jgi:hypothetical protein
MKRRHGQESWQEEAEGQTNSAKTTNLETGKAPGRRLPNARQSDSARLLFGERRFYVDWLEERALS